MARTDVTFQSLVAATDVDTMPDSCVVEDRGTYVVVRSPSNPVHFWGNLLMYRDAPAPGVREAWEADYEREFGRDRESLHVAFAWDRTDGERGAASEFEAVGYVGDAEVGLIAEPHELVRHPRANAQVEVRRLDPDGDEDLWRMATELQVANRDAGHTEAGHRAFVERRTADRRERFRSGDGAWFVALTPDGDAAAGCGVIVTDGRARYQAVDTLERYRRQGIASRLVYDVGRAAIDDFGAEHLVIVADASYHALALYESLGFVARDRGYSLCWWPGAPRAALHPEFGTRARPAE